MTENAHLTALGKARESLVAMRRQLASALSEPYKRGHSENMRDQFIRVQTAIESVESAIWHESKIATDQPGPFLR